MFMRQACHEDNTRTPEVANVAQTDVRRRNATVYTETTECHVSCYVATTEYFPVPATSGRLANIWYVVGLETYRDLTQFPTELVL